MQHRDGTSDEKQDAGRDGDVTHSAVVDVPTLDDRPGLVDAAEFRKRLEADQTSIQKSVLALLAIVAFWLAIENSYHRFTTLVVERQVQSFLSTKLLATSRKIAAATAEKAAVQLVIQSKQGKEPIEKEQQDLTSIARLIREMEHELTGLDEGTGKNKEQITKLQQEPLDLSIVGTKITSRLVVAPLICLVAILFWLNFVAARRSMAHGHLAALHARLGASQRNFGAAASGSMWIAPLPPRVQIRAGGERSEIVDRAELRWLLGWTPLTERRHARALRVFVLLCAAITLRIGFIAADLTSAAAVEAKFITSAWQWPSAILTVAITVIAIVKLLFLTLEGTGDVEGAEVPMPDRRELTVNVVALSLVAVAGAYVNQAGLLKAGRNLLAGAVGPPSSGKPSFRPRFVALAARRKRIGNRNVMRPATTAGSLVYVQPRRPSTFPVHFANSNGKVLLRSAATTAPRFKLLTLELLTNWLQSPPSFGTPNSRYSWPFEASALSLAELGKIDQACETLTLGVRLTLNSAVGAAINFRLLDLLAGLAVRSGKEDRHLLPMIKQLDAYRLRLKNSGILEAAALASTKSDVLKIRQDTLRIVRANLRAIEERAKKWTGSAALRWRTMWSNKQRPIWWHHPFELRTEPLRARPVDVAANRVDSAASTGATPQRDWRANLELRKESPVIQARRSQARDGLKRQRPVKIP